eukprot:5618786-Alexandrium_andersonii.AAC.1
MEILERVGVANEVCGEIYSTQPLAKGGNIPFGDMNAVNRFCRTFKTRTFLADNGKKLRCGPKRDEQSRHVMG